MKSPRMCRGEAGTSEMRPWRRGGYAARERRGCFDAMRSDDEKDGSDPISTRRHFAGRLDGTGKM